MPSEKAGHSGEVRSAPAAKPEHKSYSIHIDRILYKVEQARLTGAELRALPDPDIADDLDLFLVVPGGLDVLVNAGDVIEIREGQHFVSVPRDVTPGSDGR